MARRNRSSLARVRAAASCIAISPMHAKRLFPIVALILVQPAAGTTRTGERWTRRARPCAAYGSSSFVLNVRGKAIGKPTSYSNLASALVKFMYPE